MSQRPIALTESELVLNAEGIPYSQAFGDVYHSAGGGTGQARHVFLHGNDLPARWRGREHFTIVETGFGLGLNLLETWRTLDDDAAAPERLHFVSVERFPLSRAALSETHARWPEHAARSRMLLEAWPLPLAGFHRLHLAGGRITLTLLLGDAQELLPQLVARADAFFLDGFSPAKNPQLWSPGIFAQLARLAAPGATLATWTVAGAVRDGLSDAGFALEKRPGFGAKRDMLTGRFCAARGASPASGPARSRRAVVIGAGLAGTACAERLAAHGWNVDVVERHPAPAQEVSGNIVGFAAPLINLADAANAQWSRTAFLYALRHFSALQAPSVFHARGILRLARNEREAERLAAALREQCYPPEMARYAEAAEAARLAGRGVRGPGVWFASGASIDPRALCAAQLARRPDRIRAHYNVSAARLEAAPGTDGWRVLDQFDKFIAAAPVVVVACAIESRLLLPHAGLRLETARGQITLLPADAARRLDVCVTGDGHAAQLSDGRLLIGATFQPNDNDPSIRAADHAANVARAESMLPGLCAHADLSAATGRVGFRTVTSDRLPVFGCAAAAEDALPGLYAATGLGARGLVWAPLGAELLASQICDEPWPLPRSLAMAASPARFRQNRP